jgi:hypothetical protein
MVVRKVLLGESAGKREHLGLRKGKRNLERKKQKINQGEFIPSFR